MQRSPADVLDAALADLDRAFGRRRGSIGRIDACPHCFDERELAIFGGPVDAIPDQLFVRALFKWGTTLAGNPRHWRRWTPRLLRALIAGRLPLDESMLARKYSEANWRDWPPGEAAAVEAVLRAWWRYAAEPGSHAPAADDFLLPLLPNG